MKLVKLGEHREKREVNPEVIEALKFLLREAKAGRVTSLVALVSGEIDFVGHTFIPPNTMQEAMMMMAMMDLVKGEMAALVYQGIQYRDFDSNKKDEEKPDEPEDK